MNLTIQINDDVIIPEGLWNDAVSNCENAMAYRFYTITDHNFGFAGEDRPQPWPALSSKYAKEFHGGNRIPKLVLSGDLQSSIQVQESSGNGSAVYTDNPYAMSQQYGDETTNLPARPFFPIIGGKLTAYTENECLDAAADALAKTLN